METHVPAEQLSAQQTVPTGEPERVPEPSPKLVPRARWRRFFGWFWCSAAFAQARAALAEESEARRRYRTRARTASDFAERACEPQLGDGGTNPDAVACELYRQSVYWALLALKGEGDPSARPDLAGLLRDPEVRALLGKADAASNASPVLELLEKEDFVDLSERTEPEQSRLLFSMRETSERLLLLLERPAEELGVLWIRRLIRVGAVFFVLGLLALGAATLRDLREQNSDLTLNKPWRVSSSSLPGCTSPQQYCDESPSYFFHTADEKDPWVELDLAAVREFSALHIVNRRDCCSERASPLVVEVSNDQEKWKQIARREGGFRSWKVDVGRQRARYVRVRAVGVKLLHLAAVRVLP